MKRLYFEQLTKNKVDTLFKSAPECALYTARVDNGRHSRLMGDIMMRNVFKGSKFTWEQKGLVDKSEARSTYIKSLKKADIGKFEELIAFAQS